MSFLQNMKNGVISTSTQFYTAPGLCSNNNILNFKVLNFKFKEISK